MRSIGTKYRIAILFRLKFPKQHSFDDLLFGLILIPKKNKLRRYVVSMLGFPLYCPRGAFATFDAIS